VTIICAGVCMLRTSVSIYPPNHIVRNANLLFLSAMSAARKPRVWTGVRKDPKLYHNISTIVC
jgi:hypothetical protein